MEFYSTLLEEFKTLFLAQDGNLEAFFEKLGSYPMADFSFHLWYPDDLDNLCQIVSQRGFPALPQFGLMIEEEVVNEEAHEFITVMDQRFMTAFAELPEDEIESIAREWIKPFNISFDDTPAYEAIIQLRKVAQDAIACKKSLIFY